MALESDEPPKVKHGHGVLSGLWTFRWVLERLSPAPRGDNPPTNVQASPSAVRILRLMCLLLDAVET